MTVELDGQSLTPEDVVAVARHDEPVAIPDPARERVREARERVEHVVDAGEAVYGLNTGFGELVNERIPREKIETLQTNLIRSHSAGSGRECTREEVRAMLVTRVNALVKGYSGIREHVVDHLVTFLNEGVHPVVRSRGSLGASGDLAPLAHLALVLLGEGEADHDGERVSGAEALDAVGLEPVTLAPKEGLALINGTQLTVGKAALAVVDAEHIVRAADAAGALTTEVTMGTTASCDPAIHDVRPHEGQQASADNIRRLCADSGIVESHRNCDRVQDAYAIRCMPQVHGAVRDAIAHTRDAVETELNSATDNPLVFDAADVNSRASGTEKGAIISGGNFHGAPLAHRLDYLTAAMTDLAAICERRVDRMVNPNLQEPHLPPFLTAESGLRSGYMIAQYTAAALVNECRSLGRAATDNTPVSGGQEDHVSMSAQAAHHADTAVEHAATVVGVELLCAAQSLDFVDDDLEPAAGTQAVADAVREVVPTLDEDRVLAPELDRAATLARSGMLVEQVDAALSEPLQ
ncbi:histidine ammonia-lyase [Haloarchaeobius sp. HME9146]|uniref:histidine ammonia-lyase n=1 Tax=Haloarchaeobius sp. HME9146 TaxID=2978732 RepID=UPI0021BFDAAA|nr:histidine ammonia-lyase [Haloarchaeobius sp. HME9146]MCT9098457.1 histidine ammonia-lyase [Haloarchaeobius sp. HME9146]